MAGRCIVASHSGHARGRWLRLVSSLLDDMMNCTVELTSCVEVIVIGTLYKEMPLKPSILDEYAKDRGIVGQILKKQSFISPDDMLILEDGTHPLLHLWLYSTLMQFRHRPHSPLDSR